MSANGKEPYDNIKEKIKRLSEPGTPEKLFVDFWRLACETKGEVSNLRYGYDDSSREFVDKHKEKVIEIRNEVIDNLDFFVEKCIERMRKTSQFSVHYAKTNQEAQKILLEELGDNKVVFKSHTTEAEDIGIISFLKKNNIEVKTTEVGGLLVELFNYKLPSYKLGEGVHFTVDEIVAKMKEVYGVDIEPQAEAIVKYYRDTLRPELLNNVTVALTSANAIAADDGSIVLVEGSGNISLITRSCEKHIVVVGITKIVPTFFDAMLIAKMQARAPTVSMAYMSVITGPSGTSSVQGGRTVPMYGAKEVVVILVDEWRTRAAKENLFYKGFLRCIKCKSCNFICTSSRAFGNVFGGRFGLGAAAIIREYIHDGIEAAVKSGLFLCTGCEKCSNWCPAGVDLAEMMRNLKREASQKGLAPPSLSDYKKKILANKNPF